MSGNDGFMDEWKRSVDRVMNNWSSVKRMHDWSRMYGLDDWSSVYGVNNWHGFVQWC
jgi:hypothetical protein